MFGSPRRLTLRPRAAATPMLKGITPRAKPCAFFFQRS